MNKQRFEEISLIKYVGYFIIYAIIYSGARQVTRQDASLLAVLVFLIFAWGAMMLYAYEYRDEQQYFDNYYTMPVFGRMLPVILLVLLITACRIALDYLQTFFYIDYINIGKIYLMHQSKLNLYFIVITFGVIIPFLQVYLADGFFFDYLFRWQTKQSAIVGIFTSALVFAILSMEFQPVWLLANFVLGCMLAWSYLYSQALWFPMTLALINGLLTMIPLT